ncbi:tuftelin isoform X2 [Poecile atricapillus]|uniref:tuftelin isoform X2 n=1 Tax=Poecile atricapillus TaxID=48891 RepID=UPI002738A64E|nr:tuftelin isoform X2 [Poecile atricapillus]
MNGLQGWAALLEKAELSMRRPTEFLEFSSLENSPGSLENSGGDPKSAWNPEEAGPGLRLRLPRDPPGDRPKQKPVGRAFAMVAKRSDGNSLASECVKSKDGDEEIIKVYLKTRSDHEEPVTQLKSEVRHIQEVVLESNRSCSCPGNSQENPRWQEQLRERAERAERGRRQAEQEAAERELKVQELQRLLENTEKEQRDLRERLELGQAELRRLREAEGTRAAQQERSSQLEKEVATLREKIHHLDDMLKSQQRKVRQMIEQLQNSKSVIQAKDAAIQELKERVSYLEAENLEMHDRIEHLIEKQVSRAGSGARSRSRSEYVSSKRLPKPLPLIRVVET